MNYKRVGIILGIAFVAVSAYSFWYFMRPQEVVSQPVLGAPKMKDNAPGGNIADQYLGSEFRVIGVFKNERKFDDSDDISKLINQVSLLLWVLLCTSPRPVVLSPRTMTETESQTNK